MYAIDFDDTLARGLPFDGVDVSQFRVPLLLLGQKPIKGEVWEIAENNDFIIVTARPRIMKPSIFAWLLTHGLAHNCFTIVCVGGEGEAEPPEVLASRKAAVCRLWTATLIDDNVFTIMYCQEQGLDAIRVYPDGSLER